MKKWAALILCILAVFALALTAQADDPEGGIEIVPHFEIHGNPDEPDVLLWDSVFFEIHSDTVREHDVLFYYDEGVRKYLGYELYAVDGVPMIPVNIIADKLGLTLSFTGRSQIDVH